MNTAIRNTLWMAVAVVVLLGLLLLVSRHRRVPDRAAELAAQRQREELVDRLRLDLASGSEAEKSAVLAVTDEDSQRYADQARAATAAAKQAREKLESLLDNGGSQTEREALTRFSQAFAEFERVDQEVLSLAVSNTNLKASGLAFGPAMEALQEMDAALTRIVAARHDLAPADESKLVELADGARIAAWRLQSLLPPHIADQSDQKMDELEAAMTREDGEVRQCLQALAARPALSGNPDLKVARSSYDRFRDLKAQILRLSRENTNVRSLTISLNQKRHVMFRCQDALAALRNAIEHEPMPGVPARVPDRP